MLPTFDPGTRVHAGEISLRTKDRQTGKWQPWPPISVLIWEEDGKTYVHCLELDLIADGEGEEQAIKNLVDVVVEQVLLAGRENTQLYHPAPQEYWEKYFEIRKNYFTQAFLNSPPRARNDVDFKFKEPLLAHA